MSRRGPDVIGRSMIRVRVIRRSGAIPALLAALVLTACDRGGAESNGGGPRAIGAAPAPPYEPIPMEQFGRIQGTVTWGGSPPDDSLVAVPDSLAGTCRTRTLRLSPVHSARGGVSNVVVSVSDLRKGKPLPPSRRFEIATSRCRLVPEVQGAIAGGMLNVLSLDRLVHRVSFIDSGSGAVIDRVEQFDAGQVVPLESVLRDARLVAVRSDRLSWMAAWIHVFDHPYFAISDDRGAFWIDSIPPGTYGLELWHATTGWRDTLVTVAAGDTLRLAFLLAGERP